MIAKPAMTIAHTAEKFDGYDVGRRVVRYVCSHVTDPPAGALSDHGSLGCLRYGSPDDGTHCGQASSNYLIARSGEIFEIVPPEHAAWAMGVLNNPLPNPIVAECVRTGTNPNQWGVSIEHESYDGQSLTAAQWATTARLQAWLCQQFALTPDRAHLFGHNTIDSVNRAHCPGWTDAQWDKLARDVRALLGTGVDRDAFLKDVWAKLRDACVSVGLPDPLGLYQRGGWADLSAIAPTLPSNVQVLLCEKAVLWTAYGVSAELFHRGQFEALEVQGHAGRY